MNLCEEDQDGRLSADRRHNVESPFLPTFRHPRFMWEIGCITFTATDEIPCA